MGPRDSIAGIRPFAEISRGPMTVVYKGYDPSLDRFVLLKVLRPEYARDLHVKGTFSNEARLLAKVRHPNVVAVFSSGVVDETAYLVAEFVEGLSLRELLDRRTVPSGAAAFITSRIAEGLDAAHAAGVLHRDLKPDNILLSIEGEIKISDFGLAVTSESVGEQLPPIAGTLGFVAPEVINGEPPTEAADLFSLGATMYEMLSGQAAFVGSTDSDLIDATLHRNPMKGVDEFANAPAALLVLCGKLLRKKPDERIASAAAVAAEIERWLDGADDRSTSQDVARLVAGGYSVAGDGSTEHAMPPQYSAHAERAVKSPEAALDASSTQSRSWKWMAGAAAVTAIIALSVFSMTRPAEDPANLADPESAIDGIDPEVRAAGSTEAEGDVDEQPGLAETDQRQIDPVAAKTGSREADAPAASSNSPVQSESMTVLTAPPAETSKGPVGGSTAQETGSDAGRTVDVDLAASGSKNTPASGSAAGDLESATGSVRIRTVPWAALWVNGSPYGTQLPDTLVLAAGRHEITLRNPEFPEIVDTVEVKAGVHRDIDVSLWTSVARLSMTVVPWAIVEIDGIVRDTIPPLEKPFILTPGTHRLRLRHPDLGQVTRDIVLQAGEQRTLSYNMREASAE